MAKQADKRAGGGWRWALWRAIEPLRQRSVMRDYVELCASQWWSAERLAALAETRLNLILNIAARRVPYYAARGLPPALAAFPVLTRAELQRHGAELLADDARGPLWTTYTSGTTGERVGVKRDAPMLYFSLACAWLGDCWGAELHPTDRLLCLMGDPLGHRSRDTLLSRFSHFFHNRYEIRAFMLNAVRAQQIHAQLWRLRPSLLTGYPTSMLAYARFARELGLKPPPLKKLLPTSEQCNAEDAALLRDYFQAPVLERYGSHELGCIAHQCEQSAWHLHSEHVYLEVLRQDRTIGTTGAGALLGTCLSNHAMPLIRYQIGDFAELGGPPCVCGRGLPVFRNLEGRLGQFVYCPDGRWITSHGFLVALRGYDIQSFRLVQDEPGRVRLLLAQARLDSAQLEQIKRDYTALHGGTLRVDFEFVDEIPPLPNGKRTRAQCLLPRPGSVSVP